MLHPLKPVRVTAPAVPVVSLGEAKAHLRVDHDDENDLIEATVAAAIGHLDGWSGVLGRCLVNQGWSQGFCRFPACGGLRLPMPDVSAVTVSYIDAAGASQTLSSSAYRIVEDALGPRLDLVSGQVWPSTATRADAVVVAFTAGYGDAATDVPQALHSAILLMVGDLYRNRDTTGAGAGALGKIPMSLTVEALIAPYRRLAG